MLTRAQVRGYKCLSDVTVDLGPFNVLIGRNDSGKSSFLQAIAEPSSLRLHRKASSPPADVSSGEWSVQLDGPRVAVLQSSDSTNWELRAGSPLEILDTLPSQSVDPAVWLGKYAELVTTEPIALDPRQLAGSANMTLAPLAEFVKNRGAGLAPFLASLALGDRDRFDQIERAVRETTRGRVKSIVVNDVGNSTYELRFRLLSGKVIPASQLSQGLLLYLAFLSLVHRDPMPAVLLIEEPECGLHPLRLFEVVGLLRSLTERGVQVILTTHSPDLLSACAPGEVRVFYRPDPESPTQVHVLPADFERRAMREPLGQVWAARGEEGLLDLVTKPITPAVQADPK